MIRYPHPSDRPRQPGPIRWFHRTENLFAAAALLLMSLIPVVEFLGRRLFHSGIPGASDYLRHLTLWLGFLGASLAARDERNLKIASLTNWFPGPLQSVARMYAGVASVWVCGVLFWASLQLVIAEAPAAPEWVRNAMSEGMAAFFEARLLFEDGGLVKVGGLVPVWIAESIMPLGFLMMGFRFLWRTPPGWIGRLVAAGALPAAIAVAAGLGDSASALVIPGILLLLAAALFGAPIFVLLGGAAALLFWGDMTPVAAIPAETYRIVTSDVFPIIPIFTWVGYILSEGNASRRLERVFTSWFGWIPGGIAVAATLLCAFFTTFTGASGVTILALGALMLPVLKANRYPESFSIGLLTSTGSLGLLLPPSLVIILYGVIAHVPIVDMFLAGILPGILMILPICLLCIWVGRRTSADRRKFHLREALHSLAGAVWEMLLPVLILGLILTGLCTPVEAAAIGAVYALVVELGIYRDIKPRRLFRILVDCSTMVGGILLVLGVAMGLTSYLVDAEVPIHAAHWVEEHIHSPWVFLLALNLGLLLVGCFMDIFSALIVVVPLLLPMAQVFGIHPAHLGIIFLANLQLGYMTPPIGMNLFLASFRSPAPIAPLCHPSWIEEDRPCAASATSLLPSIA